MTISEHLISLATEAETLATHVQKRFGGLSVAELNWKPNAERWSIAQCLHHIITTNTAYFPAFEQVIQGKYSPTLVQRVPFIPRLLGRELIRILGREPLRKIKTSPMFEPSASTIAKEIIGGFALHQSRISTYLRGFSALDIERVVISAPQSGFLIFPLYDILIATVNHEFRHVRQAENVMQAVNFGIA